MTDKRSAKTTADLPPLSPKDDFVFRKLFGDQNHVDMIISFLKTFVDLPDEEYEEVTIVDPNLLPAVRDGKACVLDLKLRTKAKNIIHVEVQRSKSRAMCERMAVYGAKMPKISVKADSRVWPWLKFLAAGTKEEFDMLQQNYAELQKPVARLMELSADEITRRQKESWDKARWDEAARMRKATAEGEARGKAEGKAEIALNLLREGMSVDAVFRCTGLAVAEIEALPKN